MLWGGLQDFLDGKQAIDMTVTDYIITSHATLTQLHSN